MKMKKTIIFLAMFLVVINIVNAVCSESSGPSSTSYAGTLGIPTRITIEETQHNPNWQVQMTFDFGEAVAESICEQYFSASECESAGVCTNECNSRDTGCSADLTKRWSCEIQADGCYDKIYYSCGGSQECVNGECISPCLIQSARWSRGTVTEGEPVDLIVKGKDCNNVKVDLTYEEWDNASDIEPFNDAIDVDLLNLPKSITITGDTGRYTWTTRWIEDSDSLDKDPEYVFTAHANNTETSGTLKVTKLKYKIMNISLFEGWNLINIPLVIVNQTIEYVFREISDKIDVIYTFDPINRWLIYHFNKSIPSNNFNITAGRAYKIKAKENTTLVINGTISTLPTTLEEGWNLIGLKQTDEVSFKDFFELYANKIETAWKLVNETYVQISVSSEDKMLPVRGYWVLINETITISG